MEHVRAKAEKDLKTANSKCALLESGQSQSETWKAKACAKIKDLTESGEKHAASNPSTRDVRALRTSHSQPYQHA